MTPEQILAIRPEVLTQQQREFHFENGYNLQERLLPDDWVARLRKDDRLNGRQEPQHHQVGSKIAAGGMM